jgi:hypothetical protein
MMAMNTNNHDQETNKVITIRKNELKNNNDEWKTTTWKPISNPNKEEQKNKNDNNE